MAACAPDMGAGVVGVGLLVGALGELRDVALDGAVGDDEGDVVAAGAALGPWRKLEVVEARDEVGDPLMPARFHGPEVALAAEVALIGGAALEFVVVVEDEFDLVGEVEVDGEVGDGGEAGRFGPGAVEVLVLGVEGNAEEGARAPLEGVLGAAGELDGGGAAAGDDVDELVVHVALRVQLTAGQDLGDVGVAEVAAASQVHVGAVAPQAVPGLQFNGDAVHAVHVVDGDALALGEPHVGVDLMVGVQGLVDRCRVNWRGGHALLLYAFRRV